MTKISPFTVGQTVYIKSEYSEHYRQLADYDWAGGWEVTYVLDTLVGAVELRARNGSGKELTALWEHVDPSRFHTYSNGDTVESFPKVDRVEVIDGTGRAYMNYAAVDVEVAMQDGQKTMKIFLRSRD